MTDKNSLSKKCLKLFFKTPVYNFLINKNISTDVHNILSDPWGGDINSGYNILRGYIKFFNETISIPIYPKLSLREVRKIGSVVNKLTN